MSREKMFLELFRSLWFSADFENDLEANFPSQFRQLGWNENAISNTDLENMYHFMEKHPVFN